PVAALLSKDGAVEIHLRRQRHIRNDAELVADEHVPIDGGGIHVLPELVIAPLAADVIAIVTGLGLADVADLAVANNLVGLAPGRVGHGLHADRHDAVVLVHGIDDGMGLIDGPGHGLFAVDILAG